MFQGHLYPWYEVDEVPVDGCTPPWDDVATIISTMMSCRVRYALAMCCNSPRFNHTYCVTGSSSNRIFQQYLFLLDWWWWPDKGINTPLNLPLEYQSTGEDWTNLTETKHRQLPTIPTTIKCDRNLGSLTRTYLSSRTYRAKRRSENNHTKTADHTKTAGNTGSIRPYARGNNILLR